VYKAKYVWSTWTQGGPRGAHYDATPSGWFDGRTFQEWFSNVMLPQLQKQSGKKVVIGDNLSSHISPDVLRLCNENNTSFVCLPPNATHLCQPLDVAFFGPMKRKWREIITEWKRKEKKNATMTKDVFPRQLRKLHEALAKSQEMNLKAGFRKCGIYPVSCEAILDRLPNRLVKMQLTQSTYLLYLFNDPLQKPWIRRQSACCKRIPGSPT
jgi:hypothetical protein